MNWVLADTGIFGFKTDAWTAVGLVGTVLFGARFYVQWIASEKQGASVIPVAFWWLSIAGSILQSIYFIHEWNLVGIASFVPNSLIYTRNLQLLHRRKRAASATVSTPDETPREGETR
jgi:lipid-A-disaccharide synthase-like uncharacterized protein